VVQHPIYLGIHAGELLVGISTDGQCGRSKASDAASTYANGRGALRPPTVRAPRRQMARSRPVRIVCVISKDVRYKVSYGTRGLIDGQKWPIPGRSPALKWFKVRLGCQAFESSMPSPGVNEFPIAYELCVIVGPPQCIVCGHCDLHRT
jgi:hypothetical protein